jgi:uncharacterized Ntn-hydrolase superfamily protein
MKKFLIILLISLIHQNLFATWSIILIDPRTKEIGIAGASCTYNCYGIGEIIPGKGAIIVQAVSSNNARTMGLQLILSNLSPREIMAALQNPSYDPQRQQYAVVTLNHFGDPATYTGDSTKLFRGAITGEGISVQGNTLVSELVLQEIFVAVENGRSRALRIDQILMMALEAGGNAGGDKRCGEQKATSAFIMVARSQDSKPYLNLNIFGQGRSRQNAVIMLRHKYDKWIARHL